MYIPSLFHLSASACLLNMSIQQNPRMLNTIYRQFVIDRFAAGRNGLPSRITYCESYPKLSFANYLGCRRVPQAVIDAVLMNLIHVRFFIYSEVNSFYEYVTLQQKYNSDHGIIVDVYVKDDDDDAND